MQLFEEYVKLRQITFTRAIKPPNFTREPWAITFSDRNENTYWAVTYLCWNTDQGPTVKLVESKAKPTPLDHKGDAVKAVICGAVFAFE